MLHVSFDHRTACLVMEGAYFSRGMYTLNKLDKPSCRNGA